MQKKAILSYLYFQDDQILIDELTPKDRFGEFVKNETKLRSNSVGKSMVSVVLGHAICEGYIESLDSKINDWPMLKNTLYDNQGSLPNFTAPGADRYRIRLTLTTQDQITAGQTFCYFAQVTDSQITDKVSGLDQYNLVNDLMATRTNDESGDYTVTPFFIRFEDSA